MVSASDALVIGLDHHRAGRFEEAERLYRDVLRDDPNQAQALHLLGNLAIDTGQLQAAVEHLSAAIHSDPSQPMYYLDLGEAYRRLDDVPRAIHCNQQALAVEPRLAAAHANLGLFYQQLGHLNEAADFFRNAVQLNPGDPQVQSLLGQVLLNQAESAYKLVHDAETCFREAARLNPHDPRAHYNLGRALQEQNRFAESAASYRRALELNPSDAEAHNNLGTVLQKSHAPSEAEMHYRRAIGINPNFAAAHNNLGGLLCDRQRWGDALAPYRRTIELTPHSAAAHLNLATCLSDLERHAEAARSAQTAIELDPRLARAYDALGQALQAQGRPQEARAAQRRAAELEPGNPSYQGNMVCTANMCDDLSLQEIFALHYQWAQQHAEPLTADRLPHDNDRNPTRRIRLGYVSPDFAAHPVSIFVEPILAAHDRENFEVFCYSDVLNPDKVTALLQSYVDHWRDISRLEHNEVAERVRTDRIDILVDLSGHTAGNRLLLFARKPAPVQVCYLGYQNTTGMTAIDYRVTDAWTDPPGIADQYYTEELVRLPDSFYCFPMLSDAPEVRPIPSPENGYVTFGSFSRFVKITPAVVAAWSKMLLSVPNSRLALFVSTHNEDYVCESFARHGIARERILCWSARPFGQYLDALGQVDVALDTFPLQGHTTTCQALWMGVPVITLAGQTYPSRFGSSALASLGLHDLIAHSVEQYVEIAVKLAADADRRRHLRANLRQMMLGAPILNARQFTRNLEAAYRQMWTRWCAAPPKIAGSIQ